MCGIAGQLSFTPGSDCCHAVTSMAATLGHRGPDATAVRLDGVVALAHTRLSIIDIAAGNQPMSNEDGRIWITYNGELYNFQELRRELQSHGHRFQTESDTEVIVHAWEQWGAQCVELFRGMFAFVVADWRRREIFLARDHLGIKPLYYTLDTRRLAFASELQALLAVPDAEAEIDVVALDEYLRLLYIPAPRTIYRGVSKLPPAHRMVVSFDGRTTGPERYWRLKFEPAHGRSEEEWTKGLEEVLRASVRSHLVADVPFGAFLSGGLDSTAVVGWMAEELAQPVRTFSVGFDEEDFSELEYGRLAAKVLGTDHHEEVVRPDALAILPDLVRHYGEPFGDSSAIPTYYVSRLARRHVKMVLSGDGGDEALAGYARYQRWKCRLLASHTKPAAWKRLLCRVLKRHARPGGATHTGTGGASAAMWLERVQSMSDRGRRSLWRPEYHTLLHDSVAAFDEAGGGANGCPAESLAQYLDYHTYLPGDILTKVDIASMMHGLEVRTPLVDVRVAEFVATIPFDVSLKLGPNGSWSGKRLLKRILSRRFDDAFLNRPKTGFLTPLRHWFAPGRPARAAAAERLLARQARIRTFFDSEVVATLVAEHGLNGRDRSQQIWQLLFLEEWLAWRASGRLRLAS